MLLSGVEQMLTHIYLLFSSSKHKGELLDLCKPCQQHIISTTCLLYHVGGLVDRLHVFLQGIKHICLTSTQSSHGIRELYNATTWEIVKLTIKPDGS